MSGSIAGAKFKIILYEGDRAGIVTVRRFGAGVWTTRRL